MPVGPSSTNGRPFDLLGVWDGTCAGAGGVGASNASWVGWVGPPVDMRLCAVQPDRGGAVRVREGFV